MQTTHYASVVVPQVFHLLQLLQKEHSLNLFTYFVPSKINQDVRVGRLSTTTLFVMKS